MAKILIIEDEAPIRANLIDLLEAEGYETIDAENGQLGLEAVQLERPDVVLCDVSMPVCDGWGVLRAIRGDPETAALPVIMLTARAERTDVRTGMNLGADDYVTKPFTRAELLQSIRARLTRSASPRPRTADSVSPPTDSPPPPRSIRLTVGSVLGGRYEVVGSLGVGGMGTVYAAIHKETGRRCALKIMHPNLVGSADMRSRFKLEATVTASIESEHIVQVIDAGVDTDTGVPFIVMELLRGADLKRILQQRGRVPPFEAAGYISQAAMGLDKTHARGIIHRDLKPDNVFVTERDNGQPLVKILDFGVAKVLASVPSGAATVAVGTPLYMAPEQINSDSSVLGPPVDRYALAHIAFTLMVGEPYWEREAKESVYGLITKICAGAAEPPSERAASQGVALPRAVDAWFFRATSIDAGQRFTSACELAGSLIVALRT